MNIEETHNLIFTHKRTESIVFDKDMQTTRLAHTNKASQAIQKIQSLQKK